MWKKLDKIQLIGRQLIHSTNKFPYILKIRNTHFKFHYAMQEMRKLGYQDELLTQSTGLNETDDELVLEARKTFRRLQSEFKKLTDEEGKKVVAAGGLHIIGTERHEEHFRLHPDRKSVV